MGVNASLFYTNINRNPRNELFKEITRRNKERNGAVRTEFNVHPDLKRIQKQKFGLVYSSKNGAEKENKEDKHN